MQRWASITCKGRGARRGFSAYLLLCCACVNLFFVFEADIVPDIRFIGSHAGASRWEKLFWRYPEIAGRYIEFLESRIPPGATVFLPPKGWPFYFTRNTTFMQYFLPGRKLVSADDFDVAGDFVAWARRKGITHIAMPRGVSRYGAGRHLVEGGTEERKRTAAYIQRLEETALPAVYMEEKVTTR
ncbi:MAG: hypothetical protein SVR04_16180, partial [Spirochaetota bacterium]|nr:hypothetical protein [Spirochaetota bacterium]